MEIRRLETIDIGPTVDLWYETSVKAHSFIPASYWHKNKELMSTQYLPKSEVYISTHNKNITGFIAMTNDYLAALFVDVQSQGKRIGKRLLNFIKEKRSTIQLTVYQKNMASIAFYKSQHFHVVSESIDKNTGELEFLMEWTKMK